MQEVVEALVGADWASAGLVARRVSRRPPSSMVSVTVKCLGLRRRRTAHYELSQMHLDAERLKTTRCRVLRRGARAGRWERSRPRRRHRVNLVVMQVVPPLGSMRFDARVCLILWENRVLAAVLVAAAVVEDLAGWWTRRGQKMLEMFCASWPPMTPLPDNCGIYQMFRNIIADF